MSISRRCVEEFLEERKRRETYPDAERLHGFRTRFVPFKSKYRLPPTRREAFKYLAEGREGGRFSPETRDEDDFVLGAQYGGQERLCLDGGARADRERG